MVVSSMKDDTMAEFPEQIPVDEHITSYNPDQDGDDNAESSFTLASSTYDFSYEHGRRYPSYRYGSHPFPSDDLSAKNDKILHHMLLFLFDNRHFLAPLKDPKTILDVRCNQGLWAGNMADAFPDAEIVAMDTAPIMRPTNPNLSFVVQSFTDEWILDVPDMKFDLIYARNLFASAGDFGQLYQQAFDNLEPGGYFEQVEVEIVPNCDDGSVIPGSPIHRFIDLVPSMSNAFGTDYNIALSMKELIEQTGFIDIRQQRFKVPLGPWSADPKYKMAGEYFEAFYKSGLQGWVLAPLVRKMGYSPEQVNTWCEEAFKEVDARRQHIYFYVINVTCRKPE